MEKTLLPILIDSPNEIDKDFKALGLSCRHTYYSDLVRPFFQGNLTQNVLKIPLSPFESYLLTSIELMKQTVELPNSEPWARVLPAENWELQPQSDWKETLDIEASECYTSEQLSHRFVRCGGSTILINVDRSTYAMPANSSFICADIERLTPKTEIGKFDLVVLDPPWPNKSARRARTYNTAKLENILGWRIPDFLEEEGLVLIWVTNNPRIHRFLLESLLPNWNLLPLCLYAWVKVTKLGEPIVPFGSQHRKPYELLILAIKSKQREADQKKPFTLHNLDLSGILVGIAPKNHSRKPNLTEFVKTNFPGRKKRAEFFARSLNSAWTSIGNDPLYFNNMAFFRR